MDELKWTIAEHERDLKQVNAAFEFLREHVRPIWQKHLKLVLEEKPLPQDEMAGLIILTAVSAVLFREHTCSEGLMRRGISVVIELLNFYEQLHGFRPAQSIVELAIGTPES